jgi:hypothetical protein
MQKRKISSPDYEGALAEPWPATIPFWINESTPPRWLSNAFDALPEEECEAAYEDWYASIEEVRKAHLRYYNTCADDLFAHFGIDRKSPEADRELWQALARKHVPAFKSFASFGEALTKPGAPTKLDRNDTLRFISEYVRISPSHANSKLSLAKELEKTDVCQTNGLKTETIRKLLGQLFSAVDSYLQGNATEFQRVYVEQCEPLIERLARKAVFVPPIPPAPPSEELAPIQLMGGDEALK